jgi:NDP-sugar pyrophosphorylase family protein
VGTPDLGHPTEQAQALAFCGIHVLSPQIFAKMNEEGAFSIIDAYIRLAAQGEKIIAYRADDCYWRDLGRPESILQATQDLDSGKYTAS